MAKGDLDELTISVKGGGGYDAGDRVHIKFLAHAAVATPQKMMPAEGVSDRSWWRDDGEDYRFAGLDELARWVEKALATGDLSLPGEA
jgi:hypothetical protein